MTDPADGAQSTVAPPDHAWLVALDIDGTVLHEDGTLSQTVIREVQRVRDLGHEVTLATGRSVSMTLPVLEQLELSPEYVVSSNGAILLRRDEREHRNYRREHVEHFDPTPVLKSIKERLPHAHYAVENETGMYRYTGWFPEGALDITTEQVDFDDLLTTVATRVVVIAPGHDSKEFEDAVEQLGLHQVSYAVGWTNWLDIAPDGVNKSTALERARQALGFPRHRVMAIGDGRNDIEMFRWAGAHGRAVAMGQAPPEVLAVSTEVTRPDREDGVAWALRSL
ncbi:MAG: 5-amino-6-(5-phospho-D-ribitylamino)uracil phosphatase YitU [Cellulomonadaceae bacterium TMED98]|nr:MAG: 5-amino-6-(5-phospho-D-ribitylamino)uracil phosphatase YitU [Cellulomonadaceae bacterium TMED98]